MMDQDLKDLYPRMMSIGESRLSPKVRLPKNFRELVPSFYKNGGSEYVEEVARGAEITLAGEMGPLESRLFWDEELGLKTIAIPPHGGLDLNLSTEDSGIIEYDEHNLAGHRNAALAFIIATAYVSRLLGNRR